MFGAILSNLPTLPFSHRARKSVHYICVSFAALLSLSLSTSILKCNWYTQNCTNLMYTIWWAWTDAYTHETITTTNISITSNSSLWPLVFCFALLCFCGQNVYQEVYPLNQIVSVWNGIVSYRHLSLLLLNILAPTRILWDDLAEELGHHMWCPSPIENKF